MGELRAPLLERGRECRQVEALLDRASAGSGSVAVIEGVAGVGKTSLLAVAREMASCAGVAVLPSRAGLLERDLPWNVVRQLFSGVIAAGDQRRTELLAGASAFAQPALGLAEGDGPANGSAALHGLYWLTEVLSAERPLLVAVDDAQWADLPSLQYLAYVGERIADLPVLLLATLRPTEGRGPHIQALELHGAEHRIVLRELSAAATTTLTRRELGQEAADEFCAACHRVTGGNPFVLRELLHEFASDGHKPTAAAAAAVAGITPEAVKRSVLLRLSQLSPAARELATTVGVLGAEAQLHEAARVAGLDPAEAATAADALASAGILSAGSPLGFVHPLVREVIYNDLPAHARARRHRDAAATLTELGTPAGRVALQLQHAEPAGDQWVVEQLREAARGALAEGAAEPAVQLLRRALREPPSGTAWVEVLLELARAESLIGSTAAIEHLEQALADARDSPSYSAIGVELMFILFRHGQVARAVALAHDVLGRVPPGEGVLQLRVIAAAATGAVLVPALASEMEYFVDRIPPGLTGETAAERLALSARLAAAIVTHEPLDVVGDIAERALGGQMLLTDLTSNELLYWNAASALIVADRFGAARSAIEAALQDARNRGSVIGFALSSAFRCLLDYRIGDIRHGVADGRQALEVVGMDELQIYIYAVAFVLDCLVEAGEVDEAVSLATRPELMGELPDVFAVQLMRVARARARIQAGLVVEAIDELMDVGRSVRIGPAMLPWRSRTAAGLIALGRNEQARELVNDELSMARRTKSGWGQAVALQTLATVDQSSAPGALAEALELSEHHGFALERARSLVLLGAHERRHGRRRRSEQLLNDGLEAAVICGAVLLAERAQNELVAIGLSPRRRDAIAADALTPAERRVAELAVDGMTNREIAQALFVSLRTIETHLTHCYQKLGLDSRAQLAGALAARTSAITSGLGSAS